MTQQPIMLLSSSSKESSSKKSLSNHHNHKHHPYHYPWEYLAASACAATVNYPLWRASAVGQSGFIVATESISIAGSKRTYQVRLPPSLSLFWYAFRPPYKGVIATVFGMTWARAAIFWGSDYGKSALQQRGYDNSVATLLPPLVVSTLVQCINMPVVRATITIQNPACDIRSVPASVRHIYRQYGISGLWHGTSAGILKSVPKYCTAVIVKDWMEEMLANVRMDDYCYYCYPLTNKQEQLLKSAIKSSVAGIAGAALTNPLDVIRNEMFKTNLGLVPTVTQLYQQLGWWRLATRGLGKNLIAVSVPVACTIFFTDALIQLRQQQQQRGEQLCS